MNIYTSFMEKFNDSLADDVEYFEMDVDRLSDCMNTIHKSGFTPLFKDGYTMMLLNEKDFNAVEEFFNNSKSYYGKHQPGNQELEIRIMEDGTVKEVIREENISY